MCIVAIGLSVSAQDDEQSESDNADSDDRPIEEIVVTASKREVTLQDSSLAITALSAEQLVNRGIRDFTDIASAIPGVDADESRWSLEA